MSVAGVRSEPSSKWSLPPKHLDDREWLRSLVFRAGASRELSAAAGEGDAETFGTVLAGTLNRFRGLKKSERKRLLERLFALWELPGEAVGPEDVDVASLAACLFCHDPEEVCGRVEAIIASHTEDVPEHGTLIAALWLMQTRTRRLSPSTLFSLWRWSLQASQALLAHAGPVVPDGGFGSLRTLEVQLLCGDAAYELKGGRKLVRSAIRGFRDSLEAATDTDGTPHARALPDLPGSLACLGRVTLLSNPVGEQLWNRKSLPRLRGLLERVVSLASPGDVAFLDRQTWPESDATSGDETLESPSAAHPRQLRALQAVGESFGMSRKSGLLKLLDRWRESTESGHSYRGRRISQWSLPDECHQSDWAEWACLRSGWEEDADRVVVTHDASSPRLDVLVWGIPLFRGAWSHTLSVDGQPLAIGDAWSCVCWFCDDAAAFVELEQQINGTTKIIRQACLVRNERQLLLADSIRCERAERIDYVRSLPLAPGWSLEHDSVTREAALQHADECSGRQSDREEGTRVRVFPLSSPQERIHRGDETLAIADGRFVTRHAAGASQAYVATLFDWSDKRRERPVDWNRLTVAEDGEILAASTAVAFRIRIGKQQWLLYHSQIPPRVPRTALGVHTSSETVFGRVTPDGEFEPLVEVEI